MEDLKKEIETLKNENKYRIKQNAILEETNKNLSATIIEMKIEQKEENKRIDEEHKETLESVISGVKKTNKCVLGCLGLFEWSPWTWSTHGSKVTRSRGSNSIPGTYQQQKQGIHHYCQAELSLILVDGSVSV